MNKIPTLVEIEVAKASYKNRRLKVGYGKSINAVGEFWEDGVMWCLGCVGTALKRQQIEIIKLKHIIAEKEIFSNLIATHPKCSICEDNNCIKCEVYKQIILKIGEK